MKSVILDNKEYLIIQKVENNNNCYVYLVNIDNADDICIRKEIIEDGKKFFIGLDNHDEFVLALNLLSKKV